VSMVVLSVVVVRNVTAFNVSHVIVRFVNWWLMRVVMVVAVRVVMVVVVRVVMVVTMCIPDCIAMLFLSFSYGFVMLFLPFSYRFVMLVPTLLAPHFLAMLRVFVGPVFTIALHGFMPLVPAAIMDHDAPDRIRVNIDRPVYPRTMPGRIIDNHH